MRGSILLLGVMVCACLVEGQIKEQDFWSDSSSNSASLTPGQPFLELSADSSGGRDLDTQVSSATLTIRPRGDKKHRQARDVQEVQSWRRPRQHQFVTKAERLFPPNARLYPPFSSESQDRAFRKSQRRIIYYATLPEIVRPPTRWPDRYDTPRHNQYPVGSPSSLSTAVYTSPSDNDITHVQSNIIDVSGSRYPSHQSTSKFTIIDVEPPYNYYSYNRQPPHYNRFEPYSTPHYSSPNHFYNNPYPYRDQYLGHVQSYRPELSLEPVKLQSPSTEITSVVNSTEPPVNTTRFLPDNIPVSIRSLAKFVT